MESFSYLKRFRPKFIYVTFLFTCLAAGLNAQTISLKGKVIEENKSPAIGAAVVLLSPDSSFVRGEVTDTEGNFVIDNIPEKNYLLKITFLGHADLFRKLNISASQDLGTLKLKKSATQLKEVVVETKAPIATQNGDTTSYNSKAFKVNKDATAEDLVTKMPGVTSVDGKIQAQGEDVKQVLVDGKPFFGDDPNSVLKNLPAEIIEKVQVFDKKSDASQFSGFDDGNSSKTINIITKTQFRNGVFGKVYGGGGYMDKYKGGAVINRFKDKQRFSILILTNNINEQNFSSEDLLGVMGSGSSNSGNRGNFQRGNGGRSSKGSSGGAQNSSDNFLVDIRNGITATNAAGINFSDKLGKKADLSFSYFFNWTDNKAVSSLLRQYIVGNNNGLNYSESSNAASSNQNHRFNLKFEYKLDSMNSVLLQPKGSLQLNQGRNNLFGENTRLDYTISNTDNKFSSDLMAYNFSLPVLFRHSFAKRGRVFSIDINPAYTKSEGTNKLDIYNNYYTDSIYADTVDQQSSLTKYSLNSTSSLSYSEPIGKNGALAANYIFTYNGSDSEKNTYNMDSLKDGYTLRDSSLSNVFANQYQAHAGGFSFRFNKEKFNYSFGANYQIAQLSKQQRFPGTYSTGRSFASVLPSAQFQYRFASKKNLRINYRTKNEPPSIDQLQDVLNNTNSLQLSIGNPDLRQSFQNNLSLRYSGVNVEKASSTFFLLAGTYTDDYIGNSTLVASNDTVVYTDIFLAQGSQISRPANLNGYYNLRFFFNYSFAIKAIKSNLNINLGANYNNVPALINDQINYSNTTNPSLGLVISSNISEKFDFTISSNTNYNTISNTLQTDLNSSYYSQNSKVKLTVSPVKWLQFQTEFSNQVNDGLSGGFNQSISLWNAAVAFKFMKDQKAELRLFVFDILEQNNSIQRNTTETYIEDVQTNILQRYFLLSFTYNFKKYYEKAQNGKGQEQ
jgi:hypothetical protein